MVDSPTVTWTALDVFQKTVVPSIIATVAFSGDILVRSAIKANIIDLELLYSRLEGTRFFVQSA